jgi:RNA polymerase sigma-70 factor, ECF subfamily
MKKPIQNNDRFDVLQVQMGDDEAFTRLVERYQTPVFNLCYRMLGDPDCAEDAAQESFLRAYRNINQFNSNRSFVSWLLAIAAHYCIDCLRRRKVGFLSIDQSEDEDKRPIQLADTRAIQPEAALEQSQEHQALHHILGKLKATDRAAIILRYWYEYSEVEIAQALDISVPAVKARLFRARRTIAARLGEKPVAFIPATTFSLSQVCST